MILKYTEWGIVLLVITGILLVAAWIWKRNQKRRIFIDSISLLKKNPKKTSSLFEIIRWSVFAIFIISLLILATRPQTVSIIDENKKGLDIMLAVDVSGSMNIQDVPPTRIEAAQRVIKEFVSHIQTDRIGLVVFTGVPVTLSPLTNDYAIFEDYLELLTPEKSLWLSSTGGTAVGDAILLSTGKFQKNIERQKVIILITDGQSNFGIDPIEAAQIAAKEKIKVYTILISSFRDSRAQTTLKSVAAETGAKSYSVVDQQTLAKIFLEIDSLERSEIKTSTLTQYNDAPDLFMITAVFSWISYLILTLRRII